MASAIADLLGVGNHQRNTKIWFCWAKALRGVIGMFWTVESITIAKGVINVLSADQAPEKWKMKNEIWNLKGRIWKEDRRRQKRSDNVLRRGKEENSPTVWKEFRDLSLEKWSCECFWISWHNISAKIPYYSWGLSFGSNDRHSVA
jgi:hypothetical protein